jgi:hypothetical protein
MERREALFSFLHAQYLSARSSSEGGQRHSSSCHPRRSELPLRQRHGDDATMIALVIEE